jgi:S-DNA-T family DNA segregation ATPase FtsK/SpoIIIE
MTPRRRRELLAIVSLLAGVFFGLTLLPWDVTGPIGRFVGGLLWKYCGSGAAAIPALGILTGLAGLGRLEEPSLRRAAVLLTGLAIVVPYAVALVAGIRATADLPPDYQNWTLAQRAVGVVPALFIVMIRSVVGTAGAVMVGLTMVSGLTIYCLDWHPFGRLGAGDRKRQWPKKKSSEDPAGSFSPSTSDAAAGSTGNVPGAGHGSRGKGLLGRLRRSTAERKEYLPPISLLHDRSDESMSGDDNALDRLGDVLVHTLGTFRVEGRIVGRTTGPVVTQYEVAPAPGVKVGRIASLADDLALAMRAKSIRIVAPIPGKAAVGVEVPNPTPQMVPLRDLLDSSEWRKAPAVIPIPLGKNLEGEPIIADLEKMPHLLIAGATGSGKSVCINSIITGLVYRYTPQELRMLMIDPKMVELSMYGALPHLRHPVVTDNKQAAQVLKWTIHEMERRYELFHANGARNMHDFNKKVREGKELVEPGEQRVAAATRPAESSTDAAAFAVGSGDTESPAPSLPLIYESGPLPYVVLFVDELADLMMTVQGEVEKPLAILAQKARATGIHLILATQRPSVNVITGLIKANFPSRVAFRVASKVDSRTILDQNGAETLLGNGDMLFLPPGRSEPIRIQGAFIDTDETETLMDWFRAQREAREAELEREGLLGAEPEEDILALVAALEVEEAAAERGVGDTAGERDPLFSEAAETCITHQLGSTSLLQRKLRIGYGRAARIIDQLYEAGILGPPDGSKAREVLIGMEDLDSFGR